jgi:hypothetical protein
MRRMQRIRRIAPGALSSPLQEQQQAFLLLREESFSAPGTIGPIRYIRRIRYNL